MHNSAVVNKDDLMKATILEAAGKLFQQFGVSKTTMEDIARGIGKGKSSLYYYYATKEDIFFAVVEKEKDSIYAEIQAAIDTEKTAEGKLRAMAHAKYKSLRKRLLAYKFSQLELPDHLCLFKSIRNRFDEIEVNVIKSIINEGLEAGEFDLADHNLLTVAIVFANSLKGLQIKMSFGGYPGGAVNLINSTIDILLNGIRPQK